MVYQDNKALISKILKDSEEEAKSIIEDSKIKAKEIIESKTKEAEVKAKEEAKLIIKEAEVKAKRITENLISSAKIRANWNILSGKKKLIEEAFIRLKKELENFTKTKEYKEFLKALIKQSVIIAGKEEIEVILNKNDLDKISLEEISKEISNELGRNVKLVKSLSPIDFIGGVIIKSKDGKIVINNTLESIVELKRKEIEPRISHILFGS